MNRKQKRLFRSSDYEPSCGFCQHGKASPDGVSVLCSLRGVMRRQSCCKKYEYDPLKREPACAPELPAYDPEMFAL